MSDGSSDDVGYDKDYDKGDNDRYGPSNSGNGGKNDEVMVVIVVVVIMMAMVFEMLINGFDSNCDRDFVDSSVEGESCGDGGSASCDDSDCDDDGNGDSDNSDINGNSDGKVTMIIVTVVKGNVVVVVTLTLIMVHMAKMVSYDAGDISRHCSDYEVDFNGGSDDGDVRSVDGLMVMVVVMATVMMSLIGILLNMVYDGDNNDNDDNDKNSDGVDSKACAHSEGGSDGVSDVDAVGDSDGENDADGDGDREKNSGGANGKGDVNSDGGSDCGDYCNSDCGGDSDAGDGDDGVNSDEVDDDGQVDSGVEDDNDGNCGGGDNDANGNDDESGVDVDGDGYAVSDNDVVDVVAEVMVVVIMVVSRRCYLSHDVDSNGGSGFDGDDGSGCDDYIDFADECDGVGVSGRCLGDDGAYNVGDNAIGDFNGHGEEDVDGDGGKMMTVMMKTIAGMIAIRLMSIMMVNCWS
ncbi:hypothetical protein Trydic_g5354 [Trypoxylus dichotomus]